MNAGEVCKREVVVAQEQEGVIDAARRMRECHVGDLVVVREAKGGRVPVGIITDRDLVVSVLAQDPDDVQSLTIGDVMSGDLVTAREHEDVFELLRRMRSRGIRRLPVVDSSRRLVGIITYDDALNLVARELSELARLVTHERKKEAERRR